MVLAWNRRESQEINSHIYSQMISDKVAKLLNRNRMVFSTNNATTAKCPCAKEQSWTLLHRQKFTQNGTKT
jgi:hypothetical protein